MKKTITALLAFLMLMSFIPAYAFESNQSYQFDIQGGKLTRQPELQDVIDSYFSIRNAALNPTQSKSDKTFSREMQVLTTNQELVSKESSRLSAIDNMAQYHGVHVIKSANSANILDISYPEGRFSTSTPLTLEVYEWTWIEYNDGKGGPIDSMGYATNHTITMGQDADGEFAIQDDIYDESAILGVPLNQDSNLTVSSDISLAASGVNSGKVLNLHNLIDYADKWVAHSYPTQSQNPSTYNKEVYGYYSKDCANFTSQCLAAGGMRTNDYGSGKNNGNWDGTQWWFDTYPDPQYENYDVSPPSWRYVPKFIEYWNNQGYSSVSATASNVYPGNPVINNTAHVGICVGYNSAGTPIINAHNQDVYHVPYTMIGTGTRSTIQISTSNRMVWKPSDATLITPTTTNQTSTVKYLSAGSNQYFKFTVTTAGYYTLESSYSDGVSFDTRAYLYKESETSNGQQMYLVEVAADDDSGEGVNFKIRENLAPGTYYLRVRAYSTDATGFYYLNYKRG